MWVEHGATHALPQQNGEPFIAERIQRQALELRYIPKSSSRKQQGQQVIQGKDMPKETGRNMKQHQHCLHAGSGYLDVVWQEAAVLPSQAWRV